MRSERVRADTARQPAALAAGRVAQRTKKPGDDALKQLLKDCFSSQKGTCCARTSSVFNKLRDQADGVSAVLLMWAEDADTEPHVGNHTATVATWDGADYVVDTTAAQFGGPELFVGTLDQWQELIVGLQKNVKVGEVRRAPLDKPLGNFTMASMAAEFEEELEEALRRRKHPPPRTTDQPPSGGDKPPAKSKCFLTSACVAFMGLPDDCDELTALRSFRDGWLLAQPDGPALVDEYYRVAPAIVDAIEASCSERETYAAVYATVRRCVADIEAAQPRRAMAEYEAMVRALQERFTTGSKEVSHGQ